MKLSNAEARKALGLENAMASLTEEIIVTAWRAAVKRNHPDTTEAAMANPKSDDPLAQTYTIDTLTTAKKVLLDALSGADFACKLCSGRGKVPAKMGWRTCSACKGTGDKR